MTLTTPERTLVIAAPLAFGVVGFEQLLHTGTDATLPVYEVMHWVSDSLLALPLAAAAVWSASRLAAWHGLDGTPPAGLPSPAALAFKRGLAARPPHARSLARAARPRP